MYVCFLSCYRLETMTTQCGILCLLYQVGNTGLEEIFRPNFRSRATRPPAHVKIIGDSRKKLLIPQVIAKMRIWAIWPLGHAPMGRATHRSRVRAISGVDKASGSVNTARQKHRTRSPRGTQHGRSVKPVCRNY